MSVNFLRSRTVVITALIKSDHSVMTAVVADTVHFRHLGTAALMTALMRSGHGVVMAAAIVAAMTMAVLFFYNFVSARWIPIACAQWHFSCWRLESPADHKPDRRDKRRVHLHTFPLLQVSILNAAVHSYPEFSDLKANRGAGL